MALEHGRQRSGLNSLRYALELGRQYGYRHFLWWRPSVMAQLCAYALDADIEVSYVQNLIQKRGLVPENLPVTADGWPWQFKIFTLGRFQVLKDKQPLGFFAKLQHKPIELLKALIAFGGQKVHEDHLSEALWPRIDADYAHRSLTTTLHRLRKLLGEDKAIVLQDGRLSLNPSYFWIDTWAFEQVLEKIRWIGASRVWRGTQDYCAPSASTQHCAQHQEPFIGIYVSIELRPNGIRARATTFRAEFIALCVGAGQAIRVPTFSLVAAICDGTTLCLRAGCRH